MEHANFLAQIVFDQITFCVLVLQSLTESEILSADSQTNGVVLVLHLLLRQGIHPAVALFFTYRHPASIGGAATTSETIHKDLLLMILSLASQSEFPARFKRVRLISAFSRIRHGG